MDLKDASALYQDGVLRLIATSDLSNFAASSEAGSLLQSSANMAASNEVHAAELYRRNVLKASAGDSLTEIAEEAGRDRGDGIRAHVWIAVIPETTVVSSVASGAPDTLSVASTAQFLAGDTIVVRNSDATLVETVAVVAVLTSTTMTCNLADPAGFQADIVAGGEVIVLKSVTVPVDTTVNTTSGVTFQVVTACTTGQANPIMSGEGTDLSLVDKVWAECTEVGIKGNIDRMTASAFSPTVTGVRRIFNPEPGSGGADEESDYSTKYGVAHAPTVANQGTLKSVEAHAKNINPNVLRVVTETTVEPNTLAFGALSASGGAIGSIPETEAYIEDRTALGVSVTISTMARAAVEVEATISLNSDVTLKQVWVAYVNTTAAYLDFRRWAFGTDVSASRLLKDLQNTSGVASVDIGTFSPSVDVAVADNELPYLARVTLTRADTLETIGAEIAQAY